MPNASAAPSPQSAAVRVSARASDPGLDVLGRPRAQHDPRDDHDERQPDRGRERLAGEDRDERGDRALRRGDRRDDPDLPDPQAAVDEQQAPGVADAADDQPGEIRGRHVARAGPGREDRQERDQPDDHHPRQDRPLADHARRARGAQRRRGPREGGAETAEDREHRGCVSRPRRRPAKHGAARRAGWSPGGTGEPPARRGLAPPPGRGNPRRRTRACHMGAGTR